MKHGTKQTVIACLVISGVLLSSSAAYASEGRAGDDEGTADAGVTHTTEEAVFLDELQAIAEEGSPAQFIPLEEEGHGLSTRGAYGTDPYGCTLHPSKVHLRKSGSKKNVGAKPYTRCTEAPNQINHSSTLYIVEWAGFAERPLKTKENWNINQKSLTLKSLSWNCKNSNNSLFLQKTRGSVKIGSKHYFSAVRTPQKDWDCGY